MDQKIKTGLGTIIILVIAIIVGTFVWLSQKNNPIEQPTITPIQKIATAPINQPQIVGGPCDYDKVPGTCKIISITQDDNVKFTFTSTSPLPTNDLAKNLNGQHSDAQYIFNAQNIPLKSGDAVNCEASLITKGTCTPVIIRLVK
jgi:hypothetical protein